MNKYTYEFRSKCPNNDDVILYKLVITTDQIIMVESLVEYLAKNHSSSYHEAIANSLRDVFPGSQYMSAKHHGVLIETWRK